jgi:hypothetical protein
VEFTSEVSSFRLLGFNETPTKIQTVLFNLSAFSDIEDHAYHANRLGGLIVIGTTASINPANGTIRSAGTVLGLVGLPVRDGMTPSPRNPLDVIWM